MFMNMKRKAAAVLAAVTLMTIGTTAALADFGDAAKDRGDKPRYKVGQEVEVYNSFLHISTSRKKILSCKKNDKGEWIYEIASFSCDPGDLLGPHGSISTTATLSADAIQSC